MILPDINHLKEWKCDLVIERLMADHKWSKSIATQWFYDFMCWLYSSQKWQQQTNSFFAMDTVHYLDDVWHVYILHTKEYMKMCRELFNTNYIHHTPVPAFKTELIDKNVYQRQLMFMLDDWGEDYINRVWNYAADVSDLLHGDYLPTAV